MWATLGKCCRCRNVGRAESGDLCAGEMFVEREVCTSPLEGCDRTTAPGSGRDVCGEVGVYVRVGGSRITIRRVGRGEMFEARGELCRMQLGYVGQGVLGGGGTYFDC